MKLTNEAATAWGGAFERGAAPTSAEQGVEAMSPEMISYLSEPYALIRAFVPRLLNIASDHARLKAENFDLKCRVAAGMELADMNAAEIARLKAENAALVARVGVLEEAASNAAMYLRGGFTVCPRCSMEITTEDTDAELELRAALQPAARPAGDETGGAK